MGGNRPRHKTISSHSIRYTIKSSSRPHNTPREEQTNTHPPTHMDSVPPFPTIIAFALHLATANPMLPPRTTRGQGSLIPYHNAARTITAAVAAATSAAVTGKWPAAGGCGTLRPRGGCRRRRAINYHPGAIGARCAAVVLVLSPPVCILAAGVCRNIQ